MLKAYKYQLKPTPSQKNKINQHAGIARWLYNWALNLKNQDYESNKVFSVIKIENCPKELIDELTNCEVVAKNEVIKGVSNLYTLHEEKLKKLLEDRQIKFKDGKPKTLSAFYDISHILKDFKQQEGYQWIADSSADSNSFTLKNLDTAFANWFRKLKLGQKGAPRFKTKNSRNSFQIRRFKVDFKKKSVFIPKIGWVEFVADRRIGDNCPDILHIEETSTISKTPTKKYFISILFDDGKLMPEKPAIVKEKTVGIDLGLKDHAIYSDDRPNTENPRYLSKSLDKLKFHQKKLSKQRERYYKNELIRIIKEKKLDLTFEDLIGSQGIDWNHKVWPKLKVTRSYKTQKDNPESILLRESKEIRKSYLKIAKIHEHSANQRANFLHNESHKVISDAKYTTVAIEDLNVAGMMRSAKAKYNDDGKPLQTGKKRKSGLSRSLGDAGLGMFKEQLKYKADWSGKNVAMIGRFAPSSKVCTNCGFYYKELQLSERTWTCGGCKKTLDRDKNAAVNIKKLVLEEFPFDGSLDKKWKKI